MAVRPTRTGSISTIELSTFNDNHNSESTPSFRPTAHPAPWHPKLTLYRLFILVATVGLGAAKAATSYLNLSYASITLEWIMGVVVFIILHLLGSYEEHEGERDTRHLKWMFDIDYLDYLWNVLAIFEIDRPSYRSDEFIDSRSLPRRPPITGYRISVTVLVFFFGFLKSAFGYVNLQTEVTTIECVFGIGVATCLYWLGLYEDSSTKVYPLLFHVDYASTLLDGASTGGILAVAIAKMCLCLVALTACGGVTMAFYSILTLTFNFHWYGAFFPEYPIVPITCGFMINFLFGIMSFSGIIFGLIVLYLLLRILVHLPFIFMRRRVQSAISFVKSMYEKYWLPPTSRQRRNRLFYLKRLLFRQKSAWSRPTAHRWHPKLTLYRLLILVSTIGLGAAKAITSYLNLNYASITLEWVLGVVVFLFFHLTASYEEQGTRRLNWLFRVDYFDYIWNPLTVFEVYRPAYRSDELNDTNQRPRHPMITGYRILVTILVLFFGILKSAFWYGNHQNDVTTVECVFGVGIVTCLYWLGLYETSSTKTYPALFHIDYSDKVVYALGIAVGFGQVILYLIGLAISSGVTIGSYYLVSMFSNFRWNVSMFPQFRIVALSTSAAIEGLFVTFFLWAAASSFGTIYKLLKMFARSPLGRYIARRPGPQRAISYMYSVRQDYWLPQTGQQRRSRSFYIKRFMIRQIMKLPVAIYSTYALSLFIVFLVCMVVMLASVVATILEVLALPISVTFPFACILFLPLMWVFGSVFVPDFYIGFLRFLAGIRNDYNEVDESLPLTLPHAPGTSSEARTA